MNATAVKPRPLGQPDTTFATLVHRMKTTHYLPSEDECLETGTWFNDMMQLREALDQDEDTGFESTLQALTKNNSRMAAILATVPDEKETQEEDTDPRFITGKKGKKVFRTLSMSDIKLLPRLAWLLNKILQQVGVSVGFGDANTGKTFVALDIALHIAYGMEWQGRKLKQGRVLYIYGEGNTGLINRIEAWQKHHNKPDTDAIQFICFPVQLMSEREYLCATIEDQDEVPALIVLDTFSVCAEGINENDNAEVASFIAVATYIKLTYKTHVHIIHHAGKNGLYRGAASFRGNIDTMILLSRENEQAPITMNCSKQKEAEYFPDIKLQLKQIELGLDLDTLEPITSCVVVSSDVVTSKETQTMVEEQEQESMLSILSLYGELSTEQWKKHCKENDIPIRAFSKHSKTLLTTNKVKQRTKGKNGAAIYWSLTTNEQPENLQQEPLTFNDLAKIKAKRTPEQEEKYRQFVQREHDSVQEAREAYQKIDKERSSQDRNRKKQSVNVEPSTPQTTVNRSGV